MFMGDLYSVLMLVYINDSRPCFGVFSLLIGCTAASTSDRFLLLSVSSPVFISTLKKMAQDYFETLAALQNLKLKINYHF